MNTKQHKSEMTSDESIRSSKKLCFSVRSGKPCPAPGLFIIKKLDFHEADHFKIFCTVCVQQTFFRLRPQK